MDDIIKALEKIGITATILVGILGIWLIFSIYRSSLETTKLKLEIAQLLKQINQPNQLTQPQLT